MVVEKKRYTVGDFEAFLELPENQDRLFELIDGEIVEKMPTLKHATLAARLTIRIGIFVEQHDLGRISIELRHRLEGDQHNAFIPDVSFTSNERMTPMGDQGADPQMPDLAIEIQSPRDSIRKMRAKAEYYLAHGSRMVLLVLTKKRLIEVCTIDDVQILNEDDVFDGGDVLPGFKLPVRDIFNVK
jgi:Uma2 family endonuclease